MKDRERHRFVRMLQEELIPALGCTEPIAIAYAAAVGRRTLGGMPERVDAYVSGNIVKNAKCVVVPNSGGCCGIEAAVALGLAGGDDTKELEVISGITKEQCREMHEIMAAEIIGVALLETEDTLDIVLELKRGADRVKVRIARSHLNIVCLEKNGNAIICKAESNQERVEAGKISAWEILDFADTCPLEEVRPILKRQIACNRAISKEGLSGEWGACIGQTVRGGDIRMEMIAAAAAGSDARMDGCELPVVINSGSGNQGITACMPVVTYAEATGADEERLFRALLVSNLLAICQKKQIGSLSAYCGAVSAGCAAAAGVAYLKGLSHEEVLNTFSNGLDIASGVVCDGASASCAGKIAVGVFAGLLGLDMAERRRNILPGDGIVGKDADETIAHVGRIARDGMRETDREILQIMLDNRGRI